ncbi:SH3 domain-containing kinase-binding protein 1 isoform X2 [Heptranchias perlo]|uniref:SH3 domain-containing kinase-binding protein 1 isoform X2 n=1 Tax=Heptranchias perlo TaxID=212740 RepID=UPI00355A9BD8
MVEAIVEFAYKAQHEDELTISVGDIVTNIKKEDEGWWEGELDGRRGLFPDNFVREIKKDVKKESQPVKPTEMLGAEKIRSRRCQVAFSYAPQNEDELELKIGDVIEVLGEVEEGWWEGILNGKSGMFPSNFIKELPDEQEETASTQEDTTPKTNVKDQGSPEQDATDGSGGKTDGSNGAIATEIQPKKIKGFGFGDIFKDKPIKLRPRSMEIELDNSNIDKPSGRKLPSAVSSQEPIKSEPDNRPKGKEYCKVLFPYEAQNEDELTIREGDIVIIINKECADAGWWEGEINGKRGVFPDNFVKLLPPDFEKERPKKPPPPSAPAVKPLSGPKFDGSLVDKKNEAKRIPPERPDSLPTRIEDKEEKLERDQKPIEHSKPSVPAIPPKKPLPPKTNSLNRPNTLPPKRPERPAAPAAHARSDSDPKSELGVSVLFLSTSERETLEKADDIDVASFDSVVSSTEKLNHPTTSRPKASGRRPPSQVFTSPSLSSPDYLDSPTSQEEEREDQERIELDSNTGKVKEIVKKAPRAIPVLPVSDKTLPPKPGVLVLAAGSNAFASAVPAFHHGITSAAGQRPNSPSQYSTDLKPKSDKSQDPIEEVRAQVKELRSFIEMMKSQHKKEITQLMNELDEEKKIRISLQLEVEGIKKALQSK